MNERLRMSMEVPSIIAVAIFFSTCSLVLALTAHALDNESIKEAFSGHVKECKELRDICKQALPIYYNLGKMDSLQLLADVWYDRCHGRYAEDARRIHLLLAIYNHRFDEVQISKTMAGEVEWFAHYTQYVSHDTAYKPDQTTRDFDSMTVRFAQALLKRSELSASEKLICRIYAADTTASPDELLGEQYRDTRLQKAYISWQNKFAEFNVKFSTGLWFPVGPRRHLGIHPSFGAAVGVDWFHSAFYLAGNGCFANTGDPFVAFTRDYADTVSKFTLSTAECQYVYKIWRVYPKEMQLTLSAGGQWLGVNGGSIFSLFGAVGLSYRLYRSGYGFGNTISYYGIEPRIEFSRMNTGGGTNLAGLAISVRAYLGWGGD